MDSSVSAICSGIVCLVVNCLVVNTAPAATFFYTGPNGGEFFDEANWNSIATGGGTSPLAGEIDPNIGILHDLIVDGKSVMATGPSAFVLDIGDGGALSLLSGSDLQVTNTSFNAQFELSTGATLNFINANLGVDDDIFLRGIATFSGGTVESFADDIEFFNNLTTITGTTFTSDDSTIFRGELTPSVGSSIVGATFNSASRIGIREFNVTVTDTVFDVTGDIEDVFGTDRDTATASLTLLGDSSLIADQVQEGVRLVLDGTSTATLTNETDSDEVTWFSQASTSVTLNSPGAQLILLNAQSNTFRADFDGDIDVDGKDFLIQQRNFGLMGQTNNSNGDANGDGVINAADIEVWRDEHGTKNARFSVVNGMTGIVYGLDPSTWNVNNWNGIDPVTLSILGVPLGELTVSPVPEPATLMIALVIAGSAINSRRRFFNAYH